VSQRLLKEGGTVKRLKNFGFSSNLQILIVSLYSIYLVLGPLCKPLLVMELPNKRLLLLLKPAAMMFIEFREMNGTKQTLSDFRFLTFLRLTRQKQWAQKFAPHEFVRLYTRNELQTWARVEYSGPILMRIIKHSYIKQSDIFH